jgi:predicted transcriptional regulator
MAAMNTCPSAADVRTKLQALSSAEVESLARKCGVPVATLVKIKYGQTDNPRIETVRAIWPELIGTEGAPAVPVEEVSDAG